MKTTSIKLVISIVALLMLFNVLNAQQLRVLCTAVVMSEPIPASIIAQPADTSVCAGNNAMFFISATGDEPILYQWQKNGVDISGAVNDTLFLTSIVASDTGQYRCIVNNACGSDTSDVANLTLCTVDLSFNKVFGDFSSYNSVSDIVEVNSNNFIAIGSTNDYGSGSQDVLLMNIDASANINWQKTFGHDEYVTGRLIKKLSDGNFILVGYGGFTQTSTDIIVKINSSGDTLWSKGFIGFINSCVETADGGLVFAGDITNDYGLLFKLNSSGTLLWSKKFSDGNTCMTLFRDVVETSDNGLLIAGITCANSIGQYDALVIKTDASGNIQWRKLYGGIQGESVGKVIINQDGNFVICGSTASYGAGNESAYLLCIDGSGNILWDKKYGNYDDNTTFGKIKGLPDGGYISIGHTWGTIASSFVIRTDINGDTLWTKRYGCDADGLNIIQSSDNNFYIVNTIVAPDNSYEIGNIIRANNNGDIFGNYMKPRPTLTNISSNQFSTLTTLVGGTTYGNTTPSLISINSSAITFQNQNMFKSLIIKSDVSCNGLSDGIAYLSDCSINNTYLWSNSQTTPLIENLSANTYYVTVSDQIGNSYIDSVIITQPLLLQDTVKKYICDGDSYIFNGNTYTTTGFYNDTLTAISGCDSIIVTNLITVTPDTIITDTINKIIHDGINCRDYAIEKIGNQWWTVENISSMKYSNGTDIPYIQSASLWSNTTSPAVSSYDTLISDNHYSGVLYNWYAVDTIYNGNMNVCPLNWHVPSDLEWHDLVLYIDPTATLTSVESGTAGGKLKQAGTEYWLSPNSGATNEFGFNALPTGNRSVVGNIFNVGTTSYWWTSSQFAPTAGINRSVYYNNTNVNRGTAAFKSGMAIRCIKNPEPLLISSTITNANCNGTTTGAIDINVTGGTAPYTFAWSNLSGLEDLTGLVAGTYYVTVTDASSSTLVDTFTVDEVVYIPDANFKNFLINYAIINSNLDSEIQCSEAAAYSMTINIGNLSIADLTGIEAFTSLDGLNLPMNQLTNLDISSNTTLRYLDCAFNQLTSLDLSANTNLLSLQCRSNQLTSLNLSENIALTDMQCWNNQLTSLNVKNGNNTNLTSFNATGNPNLLCIQVDDSIWANANWTFASGNIDATAHFSINCAAECIVNIPDANFKAALLANALININADGEIQCSEATAFTDSIDVSNLSITDLSGIEAFTAITDLNCNNNLLTSLNISENTALDILNCYNNQLISLDISSNTSLSFLGCGVNQLTSLNVTANTALTSLFCYTNQLTSLDVTANTALSELDCSTNQLSSLDVTANTTLSFLECGGNQITSMNLLSNTTLTNFGCSGNQLTSLNLSANVALTELYCGFNQLTSLNLSANTALFALYCNNNQLTSFNIKNGNNINFAIFDATNNPSLTCIQVDDSAFMNTNWASAKDPTASYSENCSILSLSVTSNITNVSCFGNSDGSIDITVSGGTSPYSFAWSNLSGLEDLTGLVAGTYYVTVTDASSSTLIDTFTVTEPTQLFAVVSSQNNISCFGGSDGAINIIVSGGTTPYSFNWNDGVTTEDRNGLSAGVYTVTVTDAVSCIATVSATITQPVSALSVVIISQTNVSCFGGNNGAINIIASGGTYPYSYNWSNGSTSEDLTGLIAGIYNVTVSDANSCTATSSATITEPATALSASTFSTDVTAAGANDGSANLTASGGTSPYTYLWSNGQTTQDISGLSGGNYCVTVTDANGCMTTDCFVINEPAVFTSFIIGTNINCNGNSTGEADLIVSGGVTPFTYSWTGPNSFTSTTEDLTGIPAGVYNATVTDVNSITIIASITITEPPVISISLSKTDATCQGCSDGSALATVSGGTGTYTYLWSNGATTASITGLVYGNYSVTVTDDNFCTSTGSIIINEPTGTTPIADFSASVTSICGAGSVGFTDISTGNPTSWNWNFGNGNTSSLQNPTTFYVTPGVYTVSLSVTNSYGSDVMTKTNYISVSQTNSVNAGADTIVSASSVNLNGTVSGSTTTGIWSSSGTGSFSPDITTLNAVYIFSSTDMIAGTVTLTLSSTNNGICSPASDNVVISYTAPVLNITTTQSNVSCFSGSDGSATVYASGGLSPYTYLWSNGDTTQTASNLVSGIYGVTTTDFNGIQGSTAPVTISEPQPLTTNILLHIDETILDSCDGVLNINISGGTTPYSFAWSNSATTPNINNLCAGTYTLTVTDYNNCTSILQDTILEGSQYCNLSASISSQTNVNCFGDSTGSATFLVTGGASPYSYQWNNGTNQPFNNNLISGVYTVTVYDFNSCLASGSVTISENTQIDVSAIITNVTTYGASDGAIDVTVSGGVTPYTFSWSNGGVSTSLNNLVAGVYELTVSDDYSCQFDTSFEVTEPISVISVSSIVNNVSCFGLSDGSIEITPIGGISPYTYLWSNGDTTNNLYLISSATYYVTITDANSAILIKTFIITEPTELIAYISSQTDVSCFGLADGSIISSVSGGTQPYNYNWSNSAITANIYNIISGNYYLTVYDSNNCLSSANAIVNQPAQILIISSVTDVTCGATSDGAIALTVSGGISPYTFNWSNGSSAEDLFNIPIGTYTISVTDASACTTSQNYNVGSGGNINVIDSVVNVSCFGANDGKISLNISGGISPYSINWSNGSSSNALSSLVAGNYTVTITDSTACSKVISYNISQPVSGLTATSVTTTLANCNYSCSGSATITVSGGTSPYSYLWSGGQISNPSLDMCPGMNSVTITDSNGCFKQYSVQINIQPLSKIKGNIYYSGVLLPVNAALIELWKETTSNNSGKQKVDDLQNVNNGYFEFTNLPSGTYFVKAKVIAQGDFPNTLPTWYDTTQHWFYATPITLACNSTQNINISMLQVPAMANGNTNIHGKVTTATTNKSILGEPIPGAEITLEQEPDDEPIISTTTGLDGTFNFLNVPVPDSSYIVIVDIPGYSQIETYNLTFNQNDTAIFNINYVVDTNEVGLGIYVDHTIFVPLVNGKYMEVNVFPNPFSENVNVEFTLEESANVSVDINDALGKNVANVCSENQSIGKHSYNFKDVLPAGIYFVKISVDNTVYIKKIVRK